jgi:hypothetical protein
MTDELLALAEKSRQGRRSQKGLFQSEPFSVPSSTRVEQ